MPRIPTRYMPHRITIEPYLGDGATGPLYGPGVVVRCLVEQQTRMTRVGEDRQVVSTTIAFCPLATVCTTQSRVTLADGRRPEVVAVLRRDGGGLPTPDHLEIQLS